MTQPQLIQKQDTIISPADRSRIIELLAQLDDSLRLMRTRITARRRREFVLTCGKLLAPVEN